MKQLFLDIRISLPIIFVSALTLLLLTYVGSWEASRQYSVFQASKLATQGEIITNSIESYLQAGLPINQYSGFHQLSETLLESDNSIEHLSVFDSSNQLVFFNQQSSLADKDKTLTENQNTSFKKKLSQRQYHLSETKLELKNYLIEESNSSLKLTLPLNSKFGQAGTLIIEADKTSLFMVFEKEYHNVFIVYGLIILFFALFTIIYEHYFSHSKHKKSILKTVYALSFLLMSGVIVAVVFQIYEQGAQAKTKALTDSMVSRLNSVLELGIKIEDISGINEAFTKYKISNPDIREIALIEDGMCKYHTEATLVGKQHTTQNDVYEYLVELKSNDQHNRELFVSVSLPVNIVHKAVLSSANEFITLMIACGLISLIFIDASTGISNVLTRRGHLKNKTASKKIQNDEPQDFRLGLSMIKPAYFLIVFVHALSISFLPSMVNHLADASHSSFATLSLPFTLYYALFALVLIPAGHYTEKGSLKWIMAIGCLLEVVGLSLIAFTSDYWLLVIARAFSGAGQGFFLIGLQSYLLVITPKDQRTQGAAVKVIGRNAGLIAGTSIGALIFSFTDYTTVFMIGSALSIVGMIYLWILVPKEKTLQGENIPPVNKQQTSSGLFHNVIIVFKDAEFVKSLLLVAMPGKMAITGVIMFAVPLLLMSHGFGAGEIGQALMLYYIASIVMTHYASRLVDSLDISRFILFISTIIAGISIIILGFSGVNEWNGSLSWLGGEQIAQIAILFNQLLIQTQIHWLPTAIIMLSLIFAGISNGLLTSPVVTHINKTQVAEQQGVKSVTATYTFLERGGHMMGPLVIGYLLTMALQSNIALSVFGFIILFLGIIFIFVSRKI
ncbi:MAG: MFS transporter [Gammaproteobacteria bacterium]|nr:MFS transporter [Gammaproteobacteria bacterium]